jgi:hypothetical protein
MTLLTSCFPFRRLQRPSEARSNDSFRKSDPTFIVSVEHLFNPLAEFFELTSSNNHLDNNNWTASQVELSHLYDSEDDTRSKVSSASTISTMVVFPPRRQVSFAEEERVALIPSHRDLTDSEWNALFVGCEEIDENARRNRIEWRFEGGNWKNVLEEEQLVLCSDGNRYHPITVQLHLRNLEEQHQHQQRLQMMLMCHNNMEREQQLAATVSGKKRPHPTMLGDITNIVRETKKSRMTVTHKSAQPVRRRKIAASRRHQAVGWTALCANQ